MNRRQASKALLKGQDRLHDVTAPSGLEVIVSSYWVAPKMWFDERTLAHALLDAPDVPWVNREKFFDRYLNLTPDHAEVAWPETPFAIVDDPHPAPLYLWSVRDRLSAVRSDWFDAIDTLSAPFEGDLFIWSKGYTQPLQFADADENVVAVVMGVIPADGWAGDLAEFAGGLS